MRNFMRLMEVMLEIASYQIKREKSKVSDFSPKKQTENSI